MTCDVAVTFEFETRPPETTRVLGIKATAPHTIAAKAMRVARKELRPVNWTSAVVVLFRKEAEAGK